MGKEHASQRSPLEAFEMSVALDVIMVENESADLAGDLLEGQHTLDGAQKAFERKRTRIEGAKKQLERKLATLRYKQGMVARVREYIRRGMVSVMQGKKTSGAAYWILEEGLTVDTFFNIATKFWREVPSGDAEELGTFGRILGAPAIQQIIDELTQELGFQESHVVAARGKLRVA